MRLPWGPTVSTHWWDPFKLLPKFFQVQTMEKTATSHPDMPPRKWVLLPSNGSTQCSCLSPPPLVLPMHYICWSRGEGCSRQCAAFGQARAQGRTAKPFPHASRNGGGRDRESMCCLLPMLAHRQPAFPSHLTPILPRLQRRGHWVGWGKDGLPPPIVHLWQHSILVHCCVLDVVLVAGRHPPA